MAYLKKFDFFRGRLPGFLETQLIGDILDECVELDWLRPNPDGSSSSRGGGIVAQLVARLPDKRIVHGSKPCSGTSLRV